MIRYCVLTLIAVSIGAHAHDPIYPSARQLFDWRLVSEEPDRSLFVGNIQRVGGAATFETMTVLREANKGYAYDALTQAGLVDCTTKKFELLPVDAIVLDSAPVPPPLTLVPTVPAGVDEETLDDVEAPAKGTPWRQLLEVACGEAKLSGESIRDPYRWARKRFGLRTQPPPWEQEKP
jgi:hypothetical protein